ncbi:endonuclease domain-containing protein [Atlantibacter subterraneus]|uniref:endonuclease domain-containing protein n=1 Tax=Atlantibacter subterraneus TaxID=255519 RepID=UPI0022EA8FFE|nr:endonuclease domain-containing protein [Atlantibacter subterranea]MDA3133447.1 endonuclease domain-containing protein [Atlantibacter subterranea]
MAILTQKTALKFKQILFDKQNGKCAVCILPLESVNKACLDHSHYTGHVRQLLCASCNTFEGRCLNIMYRAGYRNRVDFADVLEGLAAYWRKDYSTNPIHPSFVLDESKKFARFTRERMIKELREEGIDVDKTYSREQLVDIFKKTYREKLA